MAGIFGWVGFPGTADTSKTALNAMAAALQRPAPAEYGSVRGDWGVLGAGGPDTCAYRCDDRRISVALHGHVSWSDARLAETAASHGPGRALLEGFHQCGTAVLERITGDFSLAVCDETRGTTLLATDRSGIRPVYYAPCGGGVVFASSAGAVVAHDRVKPEIDRQGIFNYLYFHVIPGPGTVYENVRRLLPGHCLVAGGDGVEMRAYWRAEFTEDAPFGDADKQSSELLALLRDSVGHAAGDAEVGAFLSGGTDSSSVAGMLAQARPGGARTYSIGFDAEGYDEMEYARIAARHFHTEHHEYYVTPQDVVAAVPRVAEFYDQPFGNASAIPSYFCARMAREDGVERLLAGDGGDELFGGNYRYAKQSLFARYSNIPAGLRGLLEPVLFGLPFGERIAPVRKLRSYVRQAKIPMPERMESYNLLTRLGAENVLEPEFLAQVDIGAPMCLLKETYEGAHAGSMLNRMLAVDMRFVLGDSDLPKVNGMCELAGIDVVYPMLDDALVAFAARLPVIQKVNGTQLRYFFKRALRDFLPQEVLTKRKQGFGLPFGVWLRDNEQLGELTRCSLERLKQRGVVRRAFIDELLGAHHAEHAAYYGTMVWILLMLEQWFEAHYDTP